MAVGPSAPPMMAMAEASARLKSKPGIRFSARAPSRVAKMPNWAAAPRNRVIGMAIRALKSVSAPTPMKISSGNTPLSMPTWYRYQSSPPSSAIPATGMLARMAPKPMGSSSRGSNLRLIAR